MTLLTISFIGAVILFVTSALILTVGIAILVGGKDKTEAEQVVTDAKDLGQDVATLVKTEVSTFVPTGSAAVSGSTPVSGSK